MNVNKKNISKRISTKAAIADSDSLNILNLFLNIVVSKARNKQVKISSFGTFRFKKTPKRIGRNPLTKESYIIQENNKLNFSASAKIKEIINLWKK